MRILFDLIENSTSIIPNLSTLTSLTSFHSTFFGVKIKLLLGLLKTTYVMLGLTFLVELDLDDSSLSEAVEFDTAYTLGDLTSIATTLM